MCTNMDGDLSDQQCDPSQVDSFEGCNEKAGFQHECGNGRICRVCSRCMAGFQRSAQGVGFRCDQCPERRENKWRMVLGGFFALMFVLLLVKLGMGDVLEGNPSDAMNRILLNFLQVISIFVAFPLQWPPALLELFRISQTISVLGESLVNPDCELSWNPSQLFYTKMLVWALVPIGVVALNILCWRCFGIVKGVPFTAEASESAAAASVHQDDKEVELQTWTSDKSGPSAGVVVALQIAAEENAGLADGPTIQTRQNQHRRSTTQMLAKDARISKLAIIQASKIRVEILKKLKARRPTPKDHLMVSTVILWYLCYPTICRTTFRLLSCIVVGKDYGSGAPAHRLFLAANPEELCYQGHHLVMVLALGLPQMLVYVLGMPLLALLVLFRNRGRLENARTKYRWGILYVGLREERYYWDVGIVAMRKAAVFSLSVVGSSDKALAFQTHLAMLVLMLSLLAHLVGRPYQPEWWLLDVFEVSGLVVCWLLMWSGICFYMDSVSIAQRELATVCLVLVNACYAICVGAVLLRQKIKERASWTVRVHRLLSACVSDAKLRYVGGWVPAIDPASRYQSSMELLGRARVEMEREAKEVTVGADLLHRRSITWLTNPATEKKTHEPRGAGGDAGDTTANAGGSVLPNGWYMSVDPVSNDAYFYSLRGETQWERPVRPPVDWRPDTGVEATQTSGKAPRPYVTHNRHETRSRGDSIRF